MSRDGVVQAGVEQCDDGNLVETDTCRNNCMPAICGDGVVETGVEQCDDGNAVDTDACRNDCKLPTCGDGVVQSGEQCDDGNSVDDDGCRNNCMARVCGDGVLQTGEQCDGIGWESEHAARLRLLVWLGRTAGADADHRRGDHAPASSSLPHQRVDAFQTRGPCRRGPRRST